MTVITWDTKDAIDARTFKDFDLNKYLLQALDEKWYTTPTEIQQKTLDAFAWWGHIVWQSQTWTWKTAAFCLPVLNALDSRRREPQVLILAPTRELAHQIRDEVFGLSKFMYMKSMVAMWGQSKRRQIEQLEKWPQVVIWTVWRVKDLIEMRKIIPSTFDYFILDEVDRMLDMWFIDEIDEIWSRCINVKQALTFSATIPHELKDLLHRYIWDDYTKINIAPQEIVASKVDHMFMEVPAFKKYDALKFVLDKHPEDKTIVFAETKKMVDDLANQLKQEGYEAIALHWDMEQRDRFQTLKKIKTDELRILVATDVAARWLNMNQINLVINFEVPRDPESYVHRIWRTARAWAEGKAIMFVSNDEYKAVHAVEKRNNLTIKKIDHTWAELPRNEFRWRSGWGRGWRSWWWWRSRYRKPGSGGGASYRWVREWGRTGEGRSSSGWRYSQSNRSSGGRYSSGNRSSGGSSSSSDSRSSGGRYSSGNRSSSSSRTWSGSWWTSRVKRGRYS